MESSSCDAAASGKKSDEKQHRSGSTSNGDDDLLTCSMCQGLYTKPKALPCLHTFCEHCVREYVHTRMYDIRGHFPCPTCNEEVVLPPGGVSELPDNRHIVQILEICERTLRKKDKSRVKPDPGSSQSAMTQSNTTSKDLGSRIRNLWSSAASRIIDPVQGGRMLQNNENLDANMGQITSPPISNLVDITTQNSDTRCPYSRLSVMLLDVAKSSASPDGFATNTQNCNVGSSVDGNVASCNNGNPPMSDCNATYIISSNTIAAAAVMNKPSCEYLGMHDCSIHACSNKPHNSTPSQVTESDMINQVSNNQATFDDQSKSANHGIQNQLRNLEGLEGRNDSIVTNTTLLVDHTSANVASGDATNNKLVTRILRDNPRAYALGSYGLHVANFTNPIGLAVSIDGNIIVVSDHRDNRIISFNLVGQLYAIFSCRIRINDIAMTTSGTVLVSNSEPHQPLIIEYSLVGKCLRVYGTFNKLESTHAVAVLMKSSLLAAIATDTTTLYLLNNRDGRMIQKICGKSRIGASRFLATNSRDEIFLSGDRSHIIRVLDAKGKAKGQFGEFGGSDGQLCQPLGLCCDSNDNIIIADSGNSKIKRFVSISKVGCKTNWKFDKVLIDLRSDNSTRSSIAAVTATKSPVKKAGNAAAAQEPGARPVNVAVSSSAETIVVLVSGSLVSEVRVYPYKK